MSKEILSMGTPVTTDSDKQRARIVMAKALLS